MQPLIAVPITLLLVYRAYSHASITLPGIFFAALTATIHALHPSSLPFTLLVLFFLLGTSATKVKHDVKATLTLSSTGSSHTHSRTTNTNNNQATTTKTNKPTKTSQEPRSAIQVLANSGCVSLLCLLHILLHGLNSTTTSTNPKQPTSSYSFSTTPPSQSLILAGIIANYAAVTADTLSSELGILSPHSPRLITTLRPVPPGTNGGVTLTGILAGFLGALIIGITSTVFLPSTYPPPPSNPSTVTIILATALWGTLGSILDSLLGALLQASVIDRRTGKVVEAPNGGRVLVMAKKFEGDEGTTGKPSRSVGSGRDILDNNQVNFLMAAVMTVGGMGMVSWVWDVPLNTL